MRTIVTLAGVVLVMAATLAPAQEVDKPGPEHAKLKAMVGTWAATIESNGKESKGTMTYRMGLGDLWLFEQFEGEFGGMKFEGRGSTTYDARKKKYVGIWLDSMSTSHMISEGNYDKDGRMVMKGDMPMGDKSMKVTLITETKSKDHHVFSITAHGPDGKDFQMMKISYKRTANK